MSSGLFALLDDIAALAKVAASSIDDASALAAKAGTKAAGIVIDDAAVTPRYVVGLASEREIPIIAKIAKGSLKNKLLILLPGALVLSFLAPWIITPLLMAGGAFLCLEGYHKVMDLIRPGHHDLTEKTEAAPLTAVELEAAQVASAVRTDFILSAEIMAITLAGISESPLWMQAVVLALVGLGMTLLVYGVVAIIVKADDAGVALATSRTGFIRTAGRALVTGMPYFLKTLSFVGMVAMLWVGGGIIIHGLHVNGVHGPEKAVHQAAEVFASLLPSAHALMLWLGAAVIAAVLGIIIGALVDPLVKHLLQPLFVRFKRKA
jgi:uncharacterized protein